MFTVMNFKSFLAITSYVCVDFWSIWYLFFAMEELPWSPLGPVRFYDPAARPRLISLTALMELLFEKLDREFGTTTELHIELLSFSVRILPGSLSSAMIE